MVLKEIADETYNNNMVTTKLIHSKFDIVFACKTVSMEKEILCMIRSPCHQTVDTQSTAPLVLLYSRMSAQITKLSFWPHVVPWLPFPFPKLPI